MIESLHRQFPNQLVIATSLLLVSASFLFFPNLSYAQGGPAFEMLVVGDSHISGQGLLEKNKFYYLVREWLQSEVFGRSRAVNLKVKAHGGSRIDLHTDELEAMLKAGDDINKFHYAEANISTPTIRAQIDAARREYGTGETVDLVMLSGCITDVLVADIINPFYPVGKLRERIKRFCGGSMSGLLEHISSTFPNARIVVVGYFPIASRSSDVKVMIRYFLKIIEFPPKLQFLFTNPISMLGLKMLRNKIADRSKIWVRESNKEITAAIDRINTGRSRTIAYFIESPIPVEASYATKNTLLWEIGSDQLPNDETYAERKRECPPVFAEMKYRHYGRLSTKMCVLSSVAHPNIEGSKVYAEAIKNSMKKNIFDSPLREGNL